MIDKINIRVYAIYINENQEIMGYMAAFFRQVKIGVLTLTLEKKQ